MKIIEFLNQIWQDEIYPICLDTPDEESSLIETLEELNYISETSQLNCYKITNKGKLRIFYEFLLKAYEAFEGTPGGFADDCYFEDNPEWFKNHRLNEDQYEELKKKLINIGLIERGSFASFRVLSLDFEECYNDSISFPLISIDNKKSKKPWMWVILGGIITFGAGIYYWHHDIIEFIVPLIHKIF